MKKFEQFTNDKIIFGISYVYAGGPEDCTDHHVTICTEIGKSWVKSYDEAYEGPIPRQIEKSLERLGLEDCGENRWTIPISKISKEELFDKLISIGLEYDEEYDKIMQNIFGGGYDSIEDWIEQNLKAGSSTFTTRIPKGWK